jgi:uncharacterized protein YceK
MKSMFSWQAIILCYLVVFIFLLSGCSSTFVSTTVGETEYTWQMSIEKSEVID